MEVNFDLFKCRASSAHKLVANSRLCQNITEKQLEELAELEKKEKLTEKQKGRLAELLVKKDTPPKITLSDTCIEYLMEWYAWEVEKMMPISKDSMYIQYVEKGKDVEADSIRLYSIVEGQLFQKNEERVCNEYLSGVPDIFCGEDIMLSEKIVDIKSAWDYPTFLKKLHAPIIKAYDMQLKSYLDITGAPIAEVAYCLVNMPPRILDDLRYALLKKMDVVTQESPEFLSAWGEIERSSNFDKIPIHKRVYKIPIEPFSEVDRQQLYDRVKYCREWLWKFHEQYENINISEFTIQ
jgi:hypothetical protein